MDLSKDGCIVKINFNPPGIWYFVEAAGQDIVARIHGTLKLDSDEAQRSIAQQGVAFPTFLDLFLTDLARWQFIQLLKDYGTDPMPIHATYPSRSSCRSGLWQP
jgi:hypothetical protein